MALAEYHGKPCPRCGEGHPEGDPSCRSREAGFFAERLAAWNRYKEEAAARRVGWEDVVLTALLTDDAAGMREALTAFPEYVNVRVHNVLTGGGAQFAFGTTDVQSFFGRRVLKQPTTTPNGRRRYMQPGDTLLDMARRMCKGQDLSQAIQEAGGVSKTDAGTQTLHDGQGDTAPSIGSRSRTVCVTGASGYIASVLVAELKAAGHRVIGTVRDVQRFAGEPVFQDVELFQADLLEPASFAAPFAKCDAVMHTASPFWFPTSKHDAMRDFVRPALEGTQNVLQAAYAAGIRTVVLTSSTDAITPQVPADFPSDTEAGWTREFTEDDWSLDSTVENQPYRYSKRVAEKAAWEFAAAHPDLHLAVINPSGTLGPPALSRADGECVMLMKRILEGGEGGVVSNQTIGWVDVRDVALAHIRAMEPPARSMRIIVSLCRSATYLDIAQILHQAGTEFAAFPLPSKLSGPVSIRVQYSNRRCREILGLEPRPLEVAVLEMARDLVRRGIVVPPSNGS